MPEINKVTTRIGLYIQIVTKYRLVLNFQNHTSGNVNWNNKTWSYIPIDITPPPRNLDLDNVSAKASLPNIPEILQAVKENDGFRDAVVFMYCIFPDSVNTSPYAQDLLLIRATKINGAAIEFEMQSPFSAVSALFPSVFYITGKNPAALNITGYVPEVPVVSSVNLQ